MSKTFEQIVYEHGQWADSTFPNGTAPGALLHAYREVDEVIFDIQRGESRESIATEVADILGCLFDAGRRYGIDVLTVARMLDLLSNTSVSWADVRQAFDTKLQVNKGRTWLDNGDGSYSHVKKS